MTRRDYIRIARVLRYANKTITSEDQATLMQLIIVKLETELREDNPNFQPDKFRRYIFGGIT